MASPYQKLEPATGSAGVFRRKSSVTLEGIEDLLADAANVRDVTPVMITDLCEQ